MQLSVEECKWADIREDVCRANPALGKVLDDFSPGEKHGFIKAKYPYGVEILNKGKIQLPTNLGTVVSLDDPLVPARLAKKLRYSSVPIGLILAKALEVYFETDQRVMPSKIFKEGTFFGLWELFDRGATHSANIWSISSGARSLFMLPSISDERYHAKLKQKLGISEYAPKSMLSHVHVFREIAHAFRTIHQHDWECEILFFDDGWADYDEGNHAELKLRAHWLQAAWSQSLNCRSQMDYSVAWEMFSKEISRKHWKVNPYIINTIKHFIAIAEGTFPGFAPATDDSCAPVSIIQQAYIDHYLLKKYSPLIIQPSYIKNIGDYVYYSLTLPTLLEWAPKAMASASIMGEQKELKKLINLFVKATGRNDLHLDYFHCEKDQLKEVRHSSEILIDDPRMQYLESFPNNKEFCENSAFFKGCIRVQKVV
jgi:hypothetical protein